MCKLLIALAMFVSAIPLARADEYSDMAQFAQSICGDIPAGNLTRTTIQGKVQASAGVLAKIVSGSGDVSGSKTEEIYNGIPFDKLPDHIPTVSMCKSELVKILLQRKSSTIFNGFKDAAANRQSQLSYWAQWCNQQYSDYFQHNSLPPPAIVECSDESFKKYTIEGWKLYIEFTNAGPQAVDTFTANIMISGSKQPITEVIGRIARDVRQTMVVDSLTIEPTSIGVCMSYNVDGQSSWTLYRGNPPDRSFLSTAQQQSDAREDKDGSPLAKVDDGVTANPMDACIARWRMLVKSDA